MDQVGMIAVRPLCELIKEDFSEVLEPEIVIFPETPKKFKNRKKAATTTKKRIHNDVVKTDERRTSKTDIKKSRSNRKEPLPGQLRIDSFYNSAAKTYKIEPKKDYDSVTSSVRKNRKKPKSRRKALFQDNESTTSVSDNSDFVISLKTPKTKLKTECVIDLCSEGEEDKKIANSKKQTVHIDESPLVNGFKTERRSEILCGLPLNTIEEVETPVSVKQTLTPIKKRLNKIASRENIEASFETTPQTIEDVLKPTLARRKVPNKQKKSNNNCIDVKTNETRTEVTLEEAQKEVEDSAKPSRPRRNAQIKGKILNDSLTDAKTIEDQSEDFFETTQKAVKKASKPSTAKRKAQAKGRKPNGKPTDANELDVQTTQKAVEEYAKPSTAKRKAQAKGRKPNGNPTDAKDLDIQTTQKAVEESAKTSTAKRKTQAKGKKSNDGRADASNCDTCNRNSVKTLEKTVLVTPTNNSYEAQKMETRLEIQIVTIKQEESINYEANQTNESSYSKFGILQKNKKEQIAILNPTSETNPVINNKNPKIKSLRDQSSRKAASCNDVLIPFSDLNTSCHENIAFSNALLTRNPTSTKIPTPPQSLKESSLIDDELFPEIYEIVDEKEKKDLNKKPSKRKQSGKLNFKSEEIKPKRVRRVHPLPPYKVVEGTSFAVDAFRYGDIKDVTHYFLTHFHADHYIGLTKNFAYPVYMSSITAALIRVFIPIDEEFIKEMDLNEPIVIKGVEVTAIDANHCPGAVLLIFKTTSGRCILHTGDFRACAEMESEPIFWNNDIHTIYLDTTYLPKKYAFCHQADSIERALQFIEEFHEKNVGTRILYVCGSYLVGKEKFWASIAQELSFKVWMDSNRRKAQIAINDSEILSLLVDDPSVAQLHVIPMVHLNYFTLLEYIENYSAHFDVIFALRPSGWEKDSKPQYRGKVNIVGIEYSEHSSHDEMKRFVQYLKPQKVISTVPVSRNPEITPKIPENWYRYDKLTGLQRDLQPAITSYFKLQGGEQKKAVKQNPLPVPLKILSPVPDDKSESVDDEKLSPVPRNKSIRLEEMFISPIKVENEEEVKKLEMKPQIQNVSEEDDWLS